MQEGLIGEGEFLSPSPFASEYINSYSVLSPDSTKHKSLQQGMGSELLVDEHEAVFSAGKGGCKKLRTRTVTEKVSRPIAHSHGGGIGGGGGHAGFLLFILKSPSGT